MGISICLINQKGGCGKSSSCFHLAGALAAGGRSVLLVDVDPQGSISQAFFGSDAVEQMAPWETIAALFDERCDQIDPASLIRTTEIDGIHVLPANHHLAAFNQPSPEQSGVMQFALRDFLEPLNKFDIVLFDCPPNLYRCSWNAMIAAEHVLIPIPPEDFGTQGFVRSIKRSRMFVSSTPRSAAWGMSLPAVTGECSCIAPMRHGCGRCTAISFCKRQSRNCPPSKWRSPAGSRLKCTTRALRRQLPPANSPTRFWNAFKRRKYNRRQRSHGKHSQPLGGSSWPLG